MTALPFQPRGLACALATSTLLGCSLVEPQRLPPEPAPAKPTVAMSRLSPEIRECLANALLVYRGGDKPPLVAGVRLLKDDTRSGGVNGSEVPFEITGAIRTVLNHIGFRVTDIVTEGPLLPSAVVPDFVVTGGITSVDRAIKTVIITDDGGVGWGPVGGNRSRTVTISTTQIGVDIMLLEARAQTTPANRRSAATMVITLERVVGEDKMSVELYIASLGKALSWRYVPGAHESTHLAATAAVVLALEGYLAAPLLSRCYGADIASSDRTVYPVIREKFAGLEPAEQAGWIGRLVRYFPGAIELPGSERLALIDLPPVNSLNDPLIRLALDAVRTQHNLLFNDDDPLTIHRALFFSLPIDGERARRVEEVERSWIGTLRVISRREVIVTVNGKPKGRSSQLLLLTDGTYSIGVAGGKTTKSVRVIRGSETVVRL